MADNANFPVPPANFEFLVESILMQAQLQLGLLKFDEADDEELEPNLTLARHSIDLLAMLQQKTEGHLTAAEIGLLESGLAELRIRYVEVSEALKAKTGNAPQAATASALADDAPRIIIPGGGKGTKTY